MATVPELKAEAKALEIVGYSTMRKPQLEIAIEAARALKAEKVKQSFRDKREARAERETLGHFGPADTDAVMASVTDDVLSATDGIVDASDLVAVEFPQDEVDHPESRSNKINTPLPVRTPGASLSKAERAALAGARGVSAHPLNEVARSDNYAAQNGTRAKQTPKQFRRRMKKQGKAMARERVTLSLI